MKKQTVTVFILIFFSIGLTEGTQRANPGPDCWYVSKCQMDKPISSEAISSETFPTIDDQSLECHRRCVADSNCKFFTLQQFRNQGMCFLLTHCTENFDDHCIDHGTCKSGPKNCNPETPNKNCPTIASENTPAGNVHWQCMDNNGNKVNGYKGTDIAPLTTCVLRCESWKDQAGNHGHLESICQDDGTWSKSMPSDDNDELAFPAKPTNGEYPTPADVSDYKCSCQNLEIKWPPNAGDSEESWWYDPNEEDGAQFICYTPINNGTGKFIIEAENSCILFCDDHLVATVKCLNGEWTGSPKCGFWCSNKPDKTNQWTTVLQPGEKRKVNTEKPGNKG